MMMEYISCFDLIVLEIESESLHSFMILKMNIVKDEKCGAEIFDDGKVCLRNDFDDGKVYLRNDCDDWKVYFRNDCDDWKVGLRKSGCTSAFNLHQRVTQQQKDHA